MLRAMVQCSLAAWLCLSMGCEDTLALGSECGPGIDPCVQRRRVGDAGTVLGGAGDGGTTDGGFGPSDGGVMPDAGDPSAYCGGAGDDGGAR